MVVVHHSQAPVDAGSRGYELLLENGKLAVGLHHMWPGNSLKVVAKKVLPVNTWTHVTATYDGSSSATGLKVYIDGEPAELTVIRDGLTKDITYGSEPNLAIGYRCRDNGLKGGTVDELRVYNRALTAAEAADGAGRTPLAKAADLSGYYSETVDPDVSKRRDEVTAARRALSQFVNPISEIMVMEEMREPKPAFVLKRGDYDQRGERVTPGTPGVLPPLAARGVAPPNRLELARWLTTPDHPLTARVTVNRLWQQMFGRGIVETADNFGSTGSGATHPELLDWLAADFVEHRWDVKRLLKQIALSATYRQSTRSTPDLVAKDPDNILLARMSPRRLTAERAPYECEILEQGAIGHVPEVGDRQTGRREGGVPRAEATHQRVGAEAALVGVQRDGEPSVLILAGNLPQVGDQRLRGRIAWPVMDLEGSGRGVRFVAPADPFRPTSGDAGRCWAGSCAAAVCAKRRCRSVSALIRRPARSGLPYQRMVPSAGCWRLTNSTLSRRSSR